MECITISLQFSSFIVIIDGERERGGFVSPKVHVEKNFMFYPSYTKVVAKCNVRISAWDRGRDSIALKNITKNITKIITKKLHIKKLQ